MIKRRRTRQIEVGGIRVGADAPISVQSMAKTDTRDIEATVKQIKRLEKSGCDIVRVAVLDLEAVRAIKEIKKRIDIPLVADIHFHYRLAIESINAGVDKIRLNPGNIKRKEDIVEVIKLARQKRVPIRIGVNSGSLPGVIAGTSHAMTEAALAYIKFFEAMDFHDIIISLKASDVVSTVEAYREMAALCDYPFHLGITAAGPSEYGIIKSSVGIGALLAEGIGDTIRVSLTGGPEEEVETGKEILSALNLRQSGLDIISCPTCGRCEVDLIKIVRELENKLSTINYQLSTRPVKLAVMGCVVNGPGEVREADIGIAAGKDCGMLFKKGKVVKKVKEKDFVKTLLEEIKRDYPR